MTPEIRAALQEHCAVYRDGLLHDTLPFWLPRSLDQEFGGFLTSRDACGALVDSDKGMWQQARFSWLLAKLYNNVEPRADWLEASRSGIEFIARHGFDPADGRMWFHVTRDGRPVRKRRYAFTESFSAIAFAQYARATGDPQMQSKAIRLFRQFVMNSASTASGTAKFEPARESISIGKPMITIATAQELRDGFGFDEADRWIDQSIDEIRNKFVHPELEAVLEVVAPDGRVIDSFDGRTLNPGHAIEAAWFMMREGQLRGDRSLIDLGQQMLRWMWRRGWDQEYGGLLYFVSLDERPVQEYWHDMKFWWPHNEAMIATLLAFRLTGEADLFGWYQSIHQWAYRYFPDRDHGEWFGYLRRDGQVSSSLKGNLWKGAFHLPRMQLVCWRLCEELLDAAG